KRLPVEEEMAVKGIIERHFQNQLAVHDLRTRRVGSHRHIDLHLLIAKGISVQRSHDLCDDLEKDIKAELFDCDLTIHVEPCETNCRACPTECAGPQPASAWYTNDVESS
ncbi:MAG: cation transporter dimerization domain-containing protein, partial [Dehalococcoidia bacterium]|nr:cation transporter dimerization domain-containing protein [Dehalococcoidia bacterium]